MFVSDKNQKGNFIIELGTLGYIKNTVSSIIKREANKKNGWRIWTDIAIKRIRERPVSIQRDGQHH